VISKENDLNYFKESLAKQAEIDHDSRQKLRDDKIKSYFDEQVMKYLINQKSQSMEANVEREQQSTVDEDTIELTRQFCNL